jgi:2-polyprenyl-3-methyl-5-hydroxy-6-metoxy-1,4-benzoquinol methylase
MDFRYQVNSPQTKYNFEERRRCPTCRSEQVLKLYSSPFESGAVGAFIATYYKIDAAVLAAAPYELMRCCSCSLVYQRFVGTSELLIDLYGEWIDDHCRPDEDPRYAEELAYPLQSRDAHEILSASHFLGISPSSLVTLDYGMGWALWARIALNLGCTSYGSDLAPSRMQFARNHRIKTLDLDAIDHPQFHFINTEQVLEHVTDPLGLAERLISALLPGGILKVSVPSAEHVDAVVAQLKVEEGRVSKSMLMPVQPLEHVNSFTRTALARFAATLGLKVVEPRILTKYAFLRCRGAISLSRPFKAAKELIRPHYQFHNNRNLYVWMQKPLLPCRAAVSI